METTGTKLRRLREAAGMTQDGLALASGVPVGTIRGIEYDRRRPLLETAAALAHAIGGHPGDLAPDVAPAKKGRGKRQG